MLLSALANATPTTSALTGVVLGAVSGFFMFVGVVVMLVRRARRVRSTPAAGRDVVVIPPYQTMRSSVRMAAGAEALVADDDETGPAQIVVFPPP